MRNHGAAETTIYKTAGGNFESRSEISIPDAMLPCFTAQRSFKVVFNVMPKEVSIDATYGVILGQDTMRELKIDTSVLTNLITWDSLTTPMVPRGYWSHETIILNGEKLSQPPSQNLSNVEVPNEVLLHDEADEPSYTSNIIPSGTASRVEEDIVEMHKICKDLQSQISCLSLEVEDERSQRIQIKAEYETQLAAVTSKYELELESILSKIHNAEVNQTSLHDKALKSIQVLQKHSNNVTAPQMEANAVSAQNEAEIEKLKQTVREYESSLPTQQQLICNQIHESKFMGEQESTIAPASKPFAGDISTMPVPKTLRSTNEVLQQANTQIHTVAGLSYDAVNFPLLDEVATKYKSFEVPKQNSTTRSLRIPVT